MSRVVSAATAVRRDRNCRADVIPHISAADISNIVTILDSKIPFHRRVLTRTKYKYRS